jgi:hypothetical protein
MRCGFFLLSMYVSICARVTPSSLAHVLPYAGYRNQQSTLRPPTDGWEACGKGAAPAPTIVYRDRESERLEAALLEAARLEAALLEAARLEAARLEVAQLEAARLEAARLEAECRAAADRQALADARKSLSSLTQYVVPSTTHSRIQPYMRLNPTFPSKLANWRTAGPLLKT